MSATNGHNFASASMSSETVPAFNMSGFSYCSTFSPKNEMEMRHFGSSYHSNMTKNCRSIVSNGSPKWPRFRGRKTIERWADKVSQFGEPYLDITSE